MELKDLRKGSLKIIQADQTDPTIRAWMVATYASLRAAKELGYEDDTFHQLGERDPSWAKMTLEKVFDREYGPSYKSPIGGVVQNENIWLRGYFFNNALMRMAALTEKGLRVLWERVNDRRGRYYEKVRHQFLDDYDYGKLRDWYIRVFLGSDSRRMEHLTTVRQQVNVFKHDHITVRLKEISKMEDALLAFSQLLELLARTGEERHQLKSQQSNANWP